MMKFRRNNMLFVVLCVTLLLSGQSNAQGIHFSQFYNAPLLISPANTGLMSDKDYRISANYRNQWGAVPVPFNTFNIQAEAQVLSNSEHTNWLGIGASVFSDKSGAGNLATTRIEGLLAYHISIGETKMLSIGMSLASVQRSVDFSQLSFDAQWDGSEFNTNLSNNEKGLVGKTNYADWSLGLNFASFSNENLYLKIGVGLKHLNQPKETFLNGTNTVGLRSMATGDLLYKLQEGIVINPSILYTQQGSAFEFLYGSLVQLNVGMMEGNTYLLAGIYHRWNDALVLCLGYDWNGLRLMGSYDYTISTLGQYINHNGAIEFCLRYSGLFTNSDRSQTRIYQCPRF